MGKDSSDPAAMVRTSAADPEEEELRRIDAGLTSFALSAKPMQIVVVLIPHYCRGIVLDLFANSSRLAKKH
jgi:hypothetical protein